MPLIEQLLISYECVSAIGTSLDLKTMMEHFFKVFSRKTGAIASTYWHYDAKQKEYNALCILGKRSLSHWLTCKPQTQERFVIEEHTAEDRVCLHVKVQEDWMVFLFCKGSVDIALTQSIVASFLHKLENAVHACKNHQELFEINQTLERRIEAEVLKNREKDKHILQQSRLAQMGEMISMIAHQWRQPLGSISAVVASLKLKLILNKFDLSSPDGREAHRTFTNESLHKIEEYVRFLTNTIDDFRNFFKPDKHKELVTTAKMVERTLDIIGKAFEINGIEVRVHNHATREIMTFTNEITQVILNLLKNAEDVIKERVISPSYVEITLKEAPKEQIIEIEDNAGGIAETILPHIFEPYFSTKHEKNGTGLGLYMSKIIIEEHCGGSIRVENGDKGARFIITLSEEIA